MAIHLMLHANKYVGKIQLQKGYFNPIHRNYIMHRMKKVKFDPGDLVINLTYKKSPY